MPSAAILAFKMPPYASEVDLLIQPLALVYPKKGLFTELDNTLINDYCFGLLAIFTNRGARPYGS